ncbi:MAG: tRNA (N(6)-L-threonylcarbamoyladenosine(37)-C(2))-methylthiotransferase [Candidatus Hodarchaeaceae archaeon]|nr:tRNA (N(6)-L-threonylcarbamoyladenosine(37)-C(2))-methylthiotransferase [Candidatus Hodarchaeaceae archaeon]
MRVYCETYGCTMNRGDTELMLGRLIEAAHERASSLAEADVVIVNTCAVKGPTQKRVLRRLEELQKLDGKHIIVAGCLPLIDLPSVERLGTFAGVISNKSLNSIGDILEQISQGKSGIRVLESGPFERPRMPKARFSEVSAIVAIAEGCRSNCSYCSVRFARGRLHSYSLDSLTEEIKNAIGVGYREILLTAQDTAAYGLDIGADLPSLLKKISSIESKFMVRIGMMNPSFVKRILPGLLEAYESDKIYKFLHLPVQSGDDDVLSAMRRDYTADDFLKIVRAFRERFEDLYLATDIIVGFPGEGEREFMHTCELIEEARPDKVNLTRFSPMPGTDASRMPQVDGREVAKRSRMLASRCRAIGYELNQHYVGRMAEGLVTEPGKKGGYVARLPNYKPAIVRHAKPGDFIKLKIVDARPTYLLGVPL